MSEDKVLGNSAPSPQRFLVVIAVVAGFAIAGVHELTRPWVAEQRATLLGRSVLDVLPEAVTFEAYRLRTDGSLERIEEPDAAALFLGRDADGRVAGVAIPASGFGYQDRIGLVYGLDPEQRRLLGMRVLESRETPGLGARIADDAAFLESFVSLELSLDDAGRPRPLRIAATAPAGPGEIDAITGATVSVRAVARIISESLSEWLQRLQGLDFHLEEPGDG